MSTAERVLEAVLNNAKSHDECSRMVYVQVVHNEKPPMEQYVNVLQSASQHAGFDIGYMDKQALRNLWRHVFNGLIPDVLEDLIEHPLGEAEMKHIKEKYGGLEETISVNEFLGFLTDKPVCHETYQGCEEMVCQQMLRNKKPNWLNVKAVLTDMPKYGSRVDTLHSSHILDLWDKIFKELSPAAIKKLEQSPMRCTHEKLGLLKEKYLQPKEEPYDDIVEDIYLTAVNDHETYKTCIEEVQKLMYIKKRKLPSGRVKYLLRPSNDVPVCNAEKIQLVKAWLKIFDHLTETAIYDMGTNGMCSPTTLQETREKYMPEAHETLKGEIEQHLEKAQGHIDTVDQSLLEIKMSNQYVDTPMKSVTYVYGTDIEDCTAEQLMKHIKRAKSDIEEVTATGVKSKYVEQQVVALTEAIDKMVEKLDSL